MEFKKYNREELKNEEMIERLVKEHLKIEDPVEQENMKKLMIYQILH